MALPLRPTVLPQLARSAKALPTGDGWVYEPKWDGFRASRSSTAQTCTSSRATAGR